MLLFSVIFTVAVAVIAVTAAVIAVAAAVVVVDAAIFVAAVVVVAALTTAIYCCCFCCSLTTRPFVSKIALLPPFSPPFHFFSSTYISFLQRLYLPERRLGHPPVVQPPLEQDLLERHHRPGPPVPTLHHHPVRALPDATQHAVVLHFNFNL